MSFGTYWLMRTYSLSFEELGCSSAAVSGCTAVLAEWMGGGLTRWWAGRNTGADRRHLQVRIDMHKAPVSVLWPLRGSCALQP